MLACETAETMGAVSTPAFGNAVTAVEPGKKLHGDARSAEPEEDPSAGVEQRCLPLRRQQAGRPASGSEANADGGISDKLKRASSATARTRRTS